MMDTFLLIGLPYLAIVTAIVATIWRLRHLQFGMSARSSQFLEDKRLLWGSAPWHIGIGIVLLGHILAWLFPGAWAALIAIPGMLVAIEILGMAASVMAVFGLMVLLFRRVTSARVQAVTTLSDLVVVLLLLAQVVLGLATAINYPSGAAWGAQIAGPYLWGILTLAPDASLVADFPMLFKLHIVGAWLLILLLPFTRLIHMLALPLEYLWRSPQKVVWNNPRRHDVAVAVEQAAESRREFIRGSIALAGAGSLLVVGVSEKAIGFFRGPRPDPEAEAALLEKKLRRLQQTAEERALELERRKSASILVARYADLQVGRGAYFIAYDMAPGLAFKGEDGLPIIRSAKCTHLGCTVGSEMDAQGRILCPCHITYFDVRSGEPNDGAPAKLPLPELPWAIMDGEGKVLVSWRPGEPRPAAGDPAALQACNVYITKPTGEV